MQNSLGWLSLQKKRVYRIFVLVFALITSNFSFSQQYPWPVKTAPALTANFGELRSNHFHMGLDARTLQRENLEVIAVEDGFISRIKIEPFGFGRAIYIEHPNGLTSVYAHLNDFYPALEKWLKDQQYALESWKVDLTVPSHLFPVKRGQFIAYSGNSGGSAGPHLHFELRDTKTEVVLNPLVHGFTISDNIAPDIIRLAIYDRNKSTYAQTPQYITLKRVGNLYTAADVVLSTNKVSFGITSYDKYTGSTNQNGIYSAKLLVNNQEEISFMMDSISYDDTRYLNAHIDYRTKLSGGPYIQHLSRLPGYTNGIYKGKDGVVMLTSEWQQINIHVSDPVGNTAKLSFRIKTTQPQAKGVKLNEPKFYPNQMNIFESDGIFFYLNDKALYDSFTFDYKKIPTAAGDVHQLHHGTVPVHQSYTVNIADPKLTDTGRVMMHYYYGTRKKFEKAKYKNGWYSATFKDFGNFKLIHDTVPPVISAITNTPTRISFTITDNTEQLKNFKATINGKWALFSNDKGKTFVYKKDHLIQKGENVLRIEVEDLSGNRSERAFVFQN